MRLADQHEEHQKRNYATDDDGAPNASDTSNKVRGPRRRGLVGNAHDRRRFLCDWGSGCGGNAAGRLLDFLDALVQWFESVMDTVGVVRKVFDKLIHLAVRS